MIDPSTEEPRRSPRPGDPEYDALVLQPGEGLDLRDIFRSIGRFLEGLILNWKGGARATIFNDVYFGPDHNRWAEAPELQDAWERTDGGARYALHMATGEYYDVETGKPVDPEEIAATMPFNSAAPGETPKNGTSAAFDGASTGTTPRRPSDTADTDLDTTGPAPGSS